MTIIARLGHELSAATRRLPGQHVLEQLHVLASGNVPAEVHFHFLLLQGTESFIVVVVQIQCALDGCVEVVCVVALEGEAQTALAVLVAGRNGVLQTTGGVDNRNGAVTHGVHLAQAAGLGLGGHQIDVAAGVDAVSQP